MRSAFRAALLAGAVLALTGCTVSTAPIGLWDAHGCGFTAAIYYTAGTRVPTWNEAGRGNSVDVRRVPDLDKPTCTLTAANASPLPKE